MIFPSIADGAALRSVLGWLHDAGFQHVHHRVLSIAPLTGLAQARRTTIRMTGAVSSLLCRSLGALRGKSEMAHQRPNARLRWRQRPGAV